MPERRIQPRIKVNWPILINTGNRSIEGTAKNVPDGKTVEIDHV
jgi:hypothetical protein